MKERKVKGTRGIVSKVEELEGLVFIDCKKLMKLIFKKHGVGRGPIIPKKKEWLSKLCPYREPLVPRWDYKKIAESFLRGRKK